MAKLTHAAHLRESEHVSRLYAYWMKVKKNTDSPVFKEFVSFYHWAMDADYSLGAKLFRKYTSEPYSPENCFWVFREDRPKDERAPEWEKLWDETVNVIRQHYGMTPIHSTEV